MADKPAKLTEGPVGHHLVDMAVPMLFGIFTMMLQGFADAYFIGRVGDRELAALSFAFPILMKMIFESSFFQVIVCRRLRR